MDWGTLVHSAVRLCREAFGPTWPLQLCLTLATSESRVSLLQLQHGVPYIVGVVCDVDHWALLVIKRGEKEAVLQASLSTSAV